jgi:hypothetical protein
MAKTAAAIEATNGISFSIAELTKTFDNIKSIVGNISDTLFSSEEGKKENAIGAREEQRYIAVAKIFDKVLNLSTLTKAFLPERENIDNNEIVTKKENNSLEEYEKIAISFNKILKITAISSNLLKIYKALRKTKIDKNKEKQNDKQKNKSLNKNVRKTEDISETTTPTNVKPKQKEISKLSIINDFIERIPVIGDLFKITKGLTQLLVASTPVLAVLSHLLSADIKPWQGTLDLIAKLVSTPTEAFKQMGEWFTTKAKTYLKGMGESLIDGLKNIFSKIKPFNFTDTIQGVYSSLITTGRSWFDGIKNFFLSPIQSIKDIVGNIFSKIKTPAATGALTEVATDGARMLSAANKGGFFAKLLGIGGKIGGKIALKSFPVIGTLLSLYFAYDRWKKGDYFGSLIEIAGGIAALFPGLGTAISIGLGVFQAWRDSDQNDESNKKFKINKDKGFLMSLIDGISDTMKSMGNFLKEKLGWFADMLGAVFDKLKKFFGWDSVDLKEPNIENLNIENKIKKLQSELAKAQKDRNVEKMADLYEEIDKLEKIKAKENANLKTKSAIIFAEKESESSGTSVEPATPAAPVAPSTTLPSPVSPTSQIKPTRMITPSVLINTDNEHSEQQVALLEDSNNVQRNQTVILQKILDNLISPNVMPNQNIPQFANNDVRLRQQRSDTRRSYLESSSIVTDLTRGGSIA